ncbi:hypothetical protein BRD00_13165 [Halobacteriales archaeon QS_8_69_26]|nr:MAG: hypothetical protein BRD00_13165 [Halobacteriales archaeon QS_8_69_26]
MRVLLFDPDYGGHHLVYPSKMIPRLEALDDDIEVTFLTARRHEVHDEFFDPEQIDFLFDPDSDILEELSEDRSAANERIYRRLREYLATNNYDVVHLLHVDDVFSIVRRHLADADASVVGLINGMFFGQDWKSKYAYSMMRLPPGGRAGELIARLLPFPNTELYRCLYERSFDYLMVNTELAKEYVEGLDPLEPRTEVSVVPTASEIWHDEGNRERARATVELPTDEMILLFFGELRTNKGIKFLLSALQSYDGPPFTMVFAGKPVDVESNDIAVRSDAVSIVRRLGFVPEERVTSYFLAADGVVVPHRPSFGKQRTSGVFQRATAAGRPVIASDFGVFTYRTKEYDLGLTFDPKSQTALLDAITTFVERNGKVHDQEAVEEFARSQSFDKLAESSLDIYKKTI